MKLKQGQLWKTADGIYRIVAWERLSITYKQISDPETNEGTLQQVTKKEFCRLIKGGELQPERPGSQASDSDPTSEEESGENKIWGR